MQYPTKAKERKHYEQPEFQKQRRYEEAEPYSLHGTFTFARRSCNPYQHIGNLPVKQSRALSGKETRNHGQGSGHDRKKARDNGEERRNHCRSGVKRHSRCRCRGRRGGGCSPRFHRAGTGSGDKGLFDLGSGLLSDNGRLPCSLGC